MNASPTTSEVASVACADSAGGFVVAWLVLGGDAPASPGDVRAMRFTLQGPVAGVAPAGGGRAAGLRARWIAGTGIRALLAVSPAARSLDVCDVLGRRVASSTIPPGATEIVLAGTRGLRAGLYFLRVRAPGGAERAKVLVTR